MINEISPRSLSRLAGIFYLTVILGGLFAQAYVADNLINFRNAGITATNILANENLYRMGYSVYLIEMTAQIVSAVLFYFLLRPVSRTGALVMMVLSLTGAIIKTVARASFLAGFSVLHNGSAYGGFTAEQVQSLSLALLRLNNDSATVALAFFGPASFITGWLVYKSSFLPRVLGIISMIGGILWSTYYWPPLGRSLFMFTALFALIGVVLTSSWLIFRGVNQQRWLERAAASGSSIWR